MKRLIIGIFLYNFCILGKVHAAFQDGEGDSVHVQIFLLRKVEGKLSQSFVDQEVEDPIPCQKNKGCEWWRKKSRLKKSSFLTVVEQGTNKIFPETKEEYWLYHVPNQKDDSYSFAIVFNNGHFFKTEPHTFRWKRESFSYTGILREYGVQDFGYSVVVNATQTIKPSDDKKEKALEGTLFCEDVLKCKTIKGKDCVYVTKKILNLEDIPTLCQTLFSYYHEYKGDSTVYAILQEEAAKRGVSLVNITDQIPTHLRNEEKYEGAEIEAIRVFDNFYKFEGLREYISQTKSAVRKLLLSSENVSLPEFNEKDYPLVGESLQSIKWEAKYNQKAARECSYLLLDQQEICKGQIEVCDLWNSQKRQLIHVKRGNDSASLNHLWGQGYASAATITQIDFPQEILSTLLRRKIIDKATQKLKEKFQREKDSLWKEFTSWLQEIKSQKHDSLVEELALLSSPPQDFKRFCDDLEVIDKKAPIVKKFISYREDLWVEQLNSMWGKIDFEKEVNRDISMHWSNISKAFQEAYTATAKKTRKPTNFTVQDLEGVLAESDVKKLHQEVYEGFTLKRKEPYEVVFSIITDKPEDRGIPLNASINLLKTIQNIQGLSVSGADLTFRVGLRIIPDKSVSKQKISSVEKTSLGDEGGMVSKRIKKEEDF